MGNSNRDYNKGYHDGRSDKEYKSPSVVETVLGAIIPGIDPAGNSEDYNRGYKDGKEDRDK